VTDRERSPTGRRDDLWLAVNDLLAAASPEQVRAHALGPLEAFRRSSLGERVPELLAVEARMAAFAMLSARDVLERVRNGCDGPLVLMKGPELAVRYPGAARGFFDVDLLTLDPLRTHDQLREAGFVEVGDDEPFRPRHHLRPLKWPQLPLLVEIHAKPHWPDGLRPPATASIVDASVPSDTNVAGVLAPERSQHALLVAAHAWAHEPLHRLRDLIDVRALAPPGVYEEIDRTARTWGIARLWRTTNQVTDDVLARRRSGPLVNLWARHLSELRERSVLENHLRAWLAAYWALPVGQALRATEHAIRNDIAPAPEEGWLDKLSRALTATRNATTPLSLHNFRLGDAATRGRARTCRRDDEETEETELPRRQRPSYPGG
jgi:hypothetical protein